MSIRLTLTALLVATLAFSLAPAISAADKVKDPPPPSPTPNPGPLPVPTVPSFVTEPFDRANVNGDASVNLADTMVILNYLFGSGARPGCMKAADSNDDSTVNIADAMFILNYLFASSIEPPPPFGYCGYDPTPDDLSCNQSPAGCPAPSCPDLAVTDISVEVLLHHAYGRDVRVTATMVNLGSTYQDPERDNKKFILMQDAAEVASIEFDALPPGYVVQVTFDTTWDKAAPDPALHAWIDINHVTNCDTSNDWLDW